MRAKANGRRNNVLAVHEATNLLSAQRRTGKGPYLLESRTDRRTVIRGAIPVTSSRRTDWFARSGSHEGKRDVIGHRGHRGFLMSSATRPLFARWEGPQRQGRQKRYGVKLRLHFDTERNLKGVPCSMLLFAPLSSPSLECLRSASRGSLRPMANGLGTGFPHSVAIEGALSLCEPEGCSAAPTKRLPGGSCLGGGLRDTPHHPVLDILMALKTLAGHDRRR
jgi:hypothetical protein